MLLCDSEILFVVLIIGQNQILQGEKEYEKIILGYGVL